MIGYARGGAATAGVRAAAAFLTGHRWSSGDRGDRGVRGGREPSRTVRAPPAFVPGLVPTLAPAPATARLSWC